MTYDDLGRQLKITSWQNDDGSGTVRNEVKFVYDGWGNVAKVYEEHSGAVDDDGQGTDSLAAQFGYEAVGNDKNVRLQTVTYPGGRVV